MDPKTFFSLPKLPYDFIGLEPVISKQTLEIHYGKHHKGYVDKYNEILEKYLQASEKKDYDLTVSLHPLLEFNGGGVINHTFFWETLCPKKEVGVPDEQLSSLIEKDFGSLENCKQYFNDKALASPGSGWCWLAIDIENQHLQIETTLLHGTLKGKKKIPLLVVDVWEHSYYLQYQNRRGDYLKAIWDIMNWKNISRRYKEVSLKNN